MTVNKARLEKILNTLMALSQRMAGMQQLIQLIHTDATWRNVDGTLALELSTLDKEKIRTFLTDYCAECQGIIDSIMAEIAEPTP